jgi:hypothetical protein
VGWLLAGVVSVPWVVALVLVAVPFVLVTVAAWTVAIGVVAVTVVGLSGRLGLCLCWRGERNAGRDPREQEETDEGGGESSHQNMIKPTAGWVVWRTSSVVVAVDTLIRACRETGV